MAKKLLDAALALASKGMAVFPIKELAKKPPLIKAWQENATTDGAQVREWWTEWPAANIGIACGLSGLCVVDLDVKGEHDGIDAWGALCVEHRIDDDTVTTTTPSGGQHLYFLAPEGVDLQNTAGASGRGLGPGIDTRAGAGYVLAPPSTNSRGAYTWGDCDQFLPLPHILRDMLTSSAPPTVPAATTPYATTGRNLSPYVARALADEVLNVSRAQEHTRNHTLNTAAFALGQLVGSAWAHLDRITVESDLLGAAQACGLPESEARKTIASGLDAGIAQPRAEPADDRPASPGADDTPPDTIKKEPAARGRPRLLALTTDDYIKLFAVWGHGVRLNLCNNEVEIGDKALDDITESIIMSKVRDYGITNRVRVNVKHARESLDVMAERNAYHPVKDFLNALKWDGQDHIGTLAGYFQEREEQQGRFLQWFGHWIVGAVARVFDGWQNPALVLDGGQDIGKSYFVSWLCPLGRHFIESAICPDQKDHKKRLMETWVWEITELGSTTRRADLEALKAFLTIVTVTLRPPYGHRDIKKPAMASFIGTINNDAGFLVDRTGNRRFLVVSLDKIDWGYADEIDVGQLWAQAMHIYQGGDAWKLSNEERKERDKVNAEYMIDDPVEAMLTDLLEYTGEETDLITLPQLLDLLRDRCTVSQKSQSMTIASVLKGWGAIKKRPRIGGEKTITYYGVTLASGHTGHT